MRLYMLKIQHADNTGKLQISGMEQKLQASKHGAVKAKCSIGESNLNFIFEHKKCPDKCKNNRFEITSRSLIFNS